MPIDQPLFLGFISFESVAFIAIAILALAVLVLSAVAIFSVYLLRKFSLSQSEAEEKRREAVAEAETILAHAREEALATMARTNEKVEAILKNTGEATSRLEGEFKAVLESLSVEEVGKLQSAYGELLSIYRTIAGEAGSSLSKAVEGVTRELTKDLHARVIQFQDALKEEALRYQRETSERVEIWRKDTEKEMENYKREALERVQRSIYDVLFFVSKRVFGKALDLEAHEELVLRALEEAKKSGFFVSNP